MRSWNTVAIIGVGLIGGSIGLALRRRNLAGSIVGLGRRRESLEKALALGCVTEIATSIADGVKRAEFVIVCTPVESIASQIVEVASACMTGCIITDAGSTKAQLVADAENALAAKFNGKLPFVGSHPIAGSEKTGPDAAAANLFEERVVVLTPTDRSDATADATVGQFWQSLGARTIRMSPTEHDEVIARTSHLPHLVASALAAATPHDGQSLSLTGSGWADTTRIASGDPELWRQILLANRGPTLKALADFEKVLATWRDALDSGNGQRLIELLKEGKSRRDTLGS